MDTLKTKKEKITCIKRLNKMKFIFFTNVIQNILLTVEEAQIFSLAFSENDKL